MTVLYFAHSRRAAGVSREEIKLEAPLDTEAFWDLLVHRHPSLEALRSSTRLARNQEFLTDDAIISEGDEIAIIPPVSGG